MWRTTTDGGVYNNEASRQLATASTTRKAQNSGGDIRCKPSATSYATYGTKEYHVSHASHTNYRFSHYSTLYNQQTHYSLSNLDSAYCYSVLPTLMDARQLERM